MNQDFNQNNIVNNGQFQPVNNQPVQGDNKKKGFPLIVILLIAAIAGAIVYFVVLPNMDDDGSSGGSGSKEEAAIPKKQVYFNKGVKGNDKLGLVIADNAYDQQVFVGVNTKGVANKLRYDKFYYNYILNDVIRIDEISYYDTQITINDLWVNFDEDTVDYETKEGKTKEYIENHEVEFKDDNYYIVGSNINKYILYFKYGENLYNWHDDEDVGVYYMYRFGFFDTIEAAKDKMNELKKILYICPFTKDETISKCNYKDYKFVEDMVIDMLNGYGIYVDSYDQIDLSSGYGYIDIKKDDREFYIRFKSYSFYEDGANKFRFNGVNFYEKNHHIYVEIEGSDTYLEIGVNGGDEMSPEELVKLFKKTFNKNEK